MATVISKPAVLVNAVLMGKIAGQPSGQREARKTLQVARLTFCGGLLGAVPLVLFARHFVHLTLGPEFRDAVSVMVLFIFSATLRGHTTATSGLLIGQGCPWSFVLLKIVILGLTILGVLALAPTMGPVGIALVQAIMSLVHTVFVAGILMVQARSAKAAFVGNDLEVLARLRVLKNFFLHTKRA
jgi:O-antigen/teichoic acid export membrane protein